MFPLCTFSVLVVKAHRAKVTEHPWGWKDLFRVDEAFFHFKYSQPHLD